MSSCQASVTVLLSTVMTAVKNDVVHIVPAIPKRLLSHSQRKMKPIPQTFGFQNSHDRCQNSITDVISHAI